MGQIVQILINLEHFELACKELEQLLIRARSSTSAGGPMTLRATEQFRSNKKTAEKRIFELVNSKIDDLVDTAEYDWYVSWTLRTLGQPTNSAQDGHLPANRRKHLHANSDTLSIYHHDLDTPRSSPRDQGAHLL